MNFPGHPTTLTVEPESGPWPYKVMFFNSGSVEVDADYIEWGSAFVRFYTKESESEHVLRHAFNVTTVEEIRELPKVVDILPEAT